MESNIYYWFLFIVFIAMGISQSVYRVKNRESFFSFLERFSRKKSNKEKKDVLENGKQDEEHGDND